MSPREDSKAYVSIVPNIITVASFASGLSAIHQAHVNPTIAIIFMCLCALLDLMDGRIARALDSQSAFGSNVDSLSDLVSFGVAPSLIVYYWGGLAEFHKLGLVVSYGYAVSILIRLARFNSSESPSDRSFYGVPSPAAAGIFIMPIITSHAFDIEINNLVQLIYCAFAALLPILPITTPSVKNIKVSKKYAGIVLLGVGCMLAALNMHFWIFLFTAGIIYHIILLRSFYFYFKKKVKA